MLHLDFKKHLASFLSHERSLFPSHLPHQLKELYLSNAILSFALSAAIVFEPVYLYTLGFPLYKIMLFYFGVYLAYFFLMPLGGKIVKRNGFEHGMIYGSFFLILYYVFLLSIQVSPNFIFLAILALAIQKSVFWPSYHADFAMFSQAGERGRDISNIVALDSIMTILGPVVSGFVVAVFGFAGLFGLLCLVVILSNAPFFLTKEIFTPSDLHYTAAYKTLLAKENRPYLFGYMGFGEELIVLTVWPIFMYLTFNNFFSTGFVAAVSTLVTALVLLYVGRESDLKNRKSVLRLGSVFTVVASLLRVVARGGMSVFLVDFFSRTSKNILMLPLLSGLYEYANKTAVVRTIIFFEMSLTVGKLLASGVMALVFFFFPTAYGLSFFIAALFSLLYLSLSGKKHEPVAAA